MYGAVLVLALRGSEGDVRRGRGHSVRGVFPGRMEAGTPVAAACAGADISGFPTWILADGTRFEGEKSLEELAKAVGFEAPPPSETPPRNSTRSWDSKRSLYLCTVRRRTHRAPSVTRTRRTRGPSRRDGDYGSLELSYSVCTRVTPTRLLFATRREGPRGTRRFRLYPATTLFTSSTVQMGTRNSSRVARTWWVPGSVPWTAGARRDAARSDEVHPDAAEAKSTASTPRRHPRRIEHRSRRRLIRHCCPSLRPRPRPQP